MWNKKYVITSLLVVTFVISGLLTLILLGKCCFKDRCAIPLQRGSISPLFARLQQGEFVYPQDTEALVLSRGESITVGCPGSKLNNGALFVETTCITETAFFISDENVDISSLYCEEPIKSTARYTGNLCEKNGKEIEIGFDFGEKHFVRQMRICFNDTEQNTLYSEHNLTNLISNREGSGRRPYFDEGNFYNLGGLKLFQLYNRSTQRTTINEQLGIKPLNSTEVIQNGSSFYLSRGHLAPKADFLYSTQQNASFYYVNSAPQWGIINSNSWNILEGKIRSFAIKRNSNFQVFTGTYGKLVLKYNLVPLYLYNLTSKAIPIPEIFWKVLFEPATHLGVAFIGTNNPFLKKDNLTLYCDDISKNLEWIKLGNMRNLTTGYLYACNVDDLRRNVTFIPQLNITGLLIK